MSTTASLSESQTRTSTTPPLCGVPSRARAMSNSSARSKSGNGSNACSAPETAAQARCARVGAKQWIFVRTRRRRRSLSARRRRHRTFDRVSGELLHDLLLGGRVLLDPPVGHQLRASSSSRTARAAGVQPAIVRADPEGSRPTCERSPRRTSSRSRLSPRLTFLCPPYRDDFARRRVHDGCTDVDPEHGLPARPHAQKKRTRSSPPIRLMKLAQGTGTPACLVAPRMR